MEIFEFYINLNNKKDYCERFTFNPPDSFEKLGSLYIIIEIKNSLSLKPIIVNGLIKTLKENYYLNSNESPRKAFERTLLKTNEYLKTEFSKTHANSFGDFNCVIFSLNQYNVLLAKLGKFDILIARGGKITSIEDNSSLVTNSKIFKNIIEGKVHKNSKIAIVSNELHSALNSKSLFADIIKKEGPEIEKILEKEKKEISSVSGILFLLSRKIIPKKEIKKEEHFSLKLIFSPFSKLIKKKKKKIKENSKKDFSFIKKQNITEKTKRDLILVSLFIFFLSLGFVLFEKNEKLSSVLNEIDQTIHLSSSLINDGKNEEALNKLQEAWEQINKLPFSENANKRQAIIEEKLKILTKMRIIESPKKEVDLKDIEIVPQGMISDETKILFFTSFSKIIIELDLQSLKITEYHSPETINSMGRMNDQFVLFSRPNKIFSFVNGNFTKMEMIEIEENDLHGIACFNNKFYFWNPENGEILVSPSKNLSSFSAWLNEGTKKTTDIRSVSVDGSVWVLSGNNNISEYFQGLYQKSFIPNLFPVAKKLSKIKTYSFFPYLYLADSSNKRIIILDKEGGIIEQIQSEKFENIIDFLVLPNGKIYVLSDLILYSI